MGMGNIWGKFLPYCRLVETFVYSDFIYGGCMQNLEVKPTVNEETCTACGLCAENCPSGAICVEDIAKIDYDRCIACGICKEICPQNAIRMAPVQQKYVGSRDEGLRSLRIRAEKIGDRLSEVEHKLQKMINSS